MINQDLENAKFAIILIGLLANFIFMVWKGGKFLGETTAAMKSLVDTVVDLKDRTIKHSEHDDKRFTEVFNSITELRVEVARGSHGKARAASQ